MIHENQNDFIYTITIDTNEKNTFDETAFQTLSLALKNAKVNPAVKVVVLTAHGDRFFSNGFEPTMFLERSYEEIVSILSLPMSATSDLLFFEKPVLSLINGHCMGVGAILALYSDYRIMIDGKARFGFPESRIGINFPSVSGFVLKELIGIRNTAKVLFSGMPYKTHEALELGLVDEVVEKDAFESAVQSYCSQFAEMAIESVLGVKKSMRDYMRPTVEFMMKTDTEDLARAISSANGQEGMKSIIEKRRPVFK